MKRNAAALVLLFALTAGVFWQLTLSNRYTFLENPDAGLQVLPWLDFEARELHAGRLPLWDPYERFGQTLIGQVQPGLANPLNWVLFAMPLREGHIPLSTLHWYWVLIHWVVAAFCFWLCRDLGASMGASLAGACIFAYTGFVAHTDTPQFLMSAVWLPVILLFFARVWRGIRRVANAALAGAAMGAALLSGHHNIPIYTGVVFGGLWVWLIARRWLRREIWLAAATFGAICLLVSALQMLPALEYGRRALRWSGAATPQQWGDKIPYSIHVQYSIGLGAIPGLVLPGLAHYFDGFVGITGVALALIGLALGWRKRQVRLLGAFSLGGLLLALGSATPVQRLAYEFIPMVDKARYPAMAIVLCQLGIAALAALGIDAWRSSRRPRIAAWLLAFFAAVVFAAYGAHTPAAIVAGAALGLAAALYLPRGLAAAAVALVLIEGLADPRPFQLRDRPGSYLKTMREQTDIADFLRRQPGWFRVETDEAAVPYNFGDWFGIEQFNGYLASMATNTARAMGLPDYRKLFGIEYRIAPRPANAAEIAVFHSRSGLNVYRDPQIGQPLWAEHSSPCAAADSLRIVSRLPDVFIVDADFGCPGLLVTGDPWFPGWRARVDGRLVPIRELKNVLRAVPVPAGPHRIEFRYMPRSVYWGAALSAFGLLLAGVIYSVKKHTEAAPPVAAGASRG